MALYRVMVDVISTEIYHVEADSADEATSIYSDADLVQETDPIVQEINVAPMED